MKKIFTLLVLTVLVSILATGCRSNGETVSEKSDYDVVIDKISEIFLPMDSDGKLYEDTLAEVEAYISGKAGHEQTMEKVKSAIATFEKLSNQVDKNTDSLDDETVAVFESCDIIPEEFEAFAASRKSELVGYADDLNFVLGYLETAPEFDGSYDELVYSCDLKKRIHEAMKGYYFYGCVNYWFTSWNEENIDKVRAEIIDKLESYVIIGYEWQTDKESVEAMTMSYLDTVEECINELTEHVAQMEKELLEMKDKFKDIG